MQQKEKKDKEISVSRAILGLSDGVLAVGVLTVLGIYGGLFLDNRFNTKPWLSLTLPLLGGGLGLARLVSKAINLDKDKPEKQV